MNEEDGSKAPTANVVVGKVYDDIVNPSAKEIGKGFVVVAKTINIALEPLNAFIWGYDRIRSYLLSSLSEKLHDIPASEITTPDAHIAVPAIEALRYCSGTDVLREMFTTLLASSMKAHSKGSVHPAFVEVIKQLSPDEAIVINALAQTSFGTVVADASVTLKTSFEQEDIREELVSTFSHKLRGLQLSNPENSGTYFENLIRLGILYIHSDYKDDMADRFSKLGIDIDNFQEIFDMRRERKDSLKITGFGRQLMESCVDT